MKITLNPETGSKYLEDLIILFTKLKQELPKTTFTQKITPYLKTLQFQLTSNISNNLKINSETGMPTHNELAIINAQKTIIKQKQQGTFSYEEIRTNLIKGIDSNKPDFSTHLTSLANTTNITYLNQITSNLNLTATTKLLEKGNKSDLLEIKLDGYSHLIKTFLEYTINVYVPKKQCAKIQEAFKNDHLIQNTNWFNLRSNEIYAMFNLEKNIESVRSVERKIIGPYISSFLEPSTTITQFNPFLKTLIQNQKFSQANPKALFFHSDISTPNYFDDSTTSPPQINIDHKYIYLDKSSKDFFSTQINERQLI